MILNRAQSNLSRFLVRFLVPFSGRFLVVFWFRFLVRFLVCPVFWFIEDVSALSPGMDACMARSEDLFSETWQATGFMNVPVDPDGVLSR